MEAREEQVHFPPLPPDSLPLWVGVLGSAAAWGAQLQTIYSLAPWACAQHRLPVLYGLEFLFLATAVVCGLLCIRYFHRGDQHTEEKDRTRFLASYGMLSSAMFSTLIVAQTIATLMLDPCMT
jgi:hypothetical protein